MRVHAQKQSQPQQKASLHPSRLTQYTIAHQAVSVLPHTNAEGREVVSGISPTTRFAHDFSRIPVHAHPPVMIQPKLAISTPGDMYEQEADRVADQVVRATESDSQRFGAYGDERHGGRTSPSDQTRQDVQTKQLPASYPSQNSLPPVVHDTLRSSGQPLEAKARASLESRFGHDFSRVRVHTDTQAAEAARAINASAYTTGQKIVFGAGEYAPGTNTGLRLLAHELTHVIQQGGAGLRNQIEPASSGLNAFPLISQTNKIGGIQRQAQKKASKLTVTKAHPKLAVAAENLGADTPVMTSYQNFQDGIWNWFFSQNGKLEGAHGKPKSLTSYSQYEKLGASTRKAIIDLAGLDETRITSKAWEALKEAYNGWPEGKYAVFQAYEGDAEEWTCNIFLGDALYLAGMTLMQGKKYYSAQQVAKGASGTLVKVPKKDVQRGDIASMSNGHHVEIVTSVIIREYLTDGFCSRGAGRGDRTLGQEKCDTIFAWAREIDESGTNFFRVL